MLTPGQSNPQLAQFLGVPELVFKREDLHPYGSHKGRAIPEMIRRYAEKGKREFAISSSGNAALAAGLFVQEYNKTAKRPLALEILIGEKISEDKRTRLAFSDAGISTKQYARPLQKLFELTRDGAVVGLRQSTDDTALAGYRPLAEEVASTRGLRAVFVATSSGTTAQALGEAFLEGTGPPEVHIVQTSAVHPMAKEFDENAPSEKQSIAGAIVDRVAHRKKAVTGVVRQTKGSGWVVDNACIQETMDIVSEQTGLELSANAALSIAGLRKALGADWRAPDNGTVLCLISGQ